MATTSLFGSVCFFMLQGKVLNENQVRETLRKNGAMEESFISSLVTHIVTDSPVDNKDNLLGDDCTAVIINSKWILLSTRCGVALPVSPFEMATDKPFSGVVACSTILSKSDKEKLWALVTYYGGTFQGRLDKNVTHLIAQGAKGQKYEAAMKHNITVVTPEWVLDCIKHQKRLEELEYTPQCDTSVLVKTVLVTTSTFPSCHGDEADVKLTGKQMRKESQEFEVEETGKQENVKAIDESMDNTSVDKSLNSTQNVDYVESSYSLDEAVETQGARSTGRSLLVLKKIESPICPLPLDKDSIASTPQPSIKKEDTTGDLKETKEEENLLQGMVFCIADYPALFDKSTVLKWKEVIGRHGGVVIDTYDSNICTHLLAQNKNSELFHQASNDTKCIASAHWLNDILSQQKMFPPSNPLHFPTALKETPEWCKKMSVTLTNYVGLERDLVRDMIRIIGIPYTGHLSRTTTHLICKRPDGRKYEKALEWNIHTVNSVLIGDIIHNGEMPTVLVSKYTEFGKNDEFNASCFEAIRLLKPWQSFISGYTHKDLIDQESCKFCFVGLQPVTQVCPLVSTDTQDECHSRAKRIKHSKTEIPSSTKRTGRPCIMFTGLSPAAVKKFKPALKSFGATITTDPQKCTHLVAPRVARTVKFLCAISVCQHIVTPDWLEESIKQNTLVDEKPYTLKDEDTEKVFMMNIPLSLERAKQRKLLNRVVIYTTQNVTPDYESLKMIVECAGGELLTQRELLSRYGRKMERLAVDGCVLIVISCPQDVASGLCQEFSRKKVPIYNAEFILTGVLRQTLNYSQNQL